MSKVKTIRVQNLRAVGNFEGTFNGCTAVITGGNNRGKSTILRALPDRLRGIKPDVILKHEESEGENGGEVFLLLFNKDFVSQSDE